MPKTGVQLHGCTPCMLQRRTATGRTLVKTCKYVAYLHMPGDSSTMQHGVERRRRQTFLSPTSSTPVWTSH